MCYYVTQKLVELKYEIHRQETMDHIQLLTIGIKNTQKISNVSEQLNNTINQFDLIDIDRTIQ